ncbi:hypothetical protein DFR55_10533 [Herbinix hemicellulosilytica]|uniref:Putative membrane protein n=1 Tax=Herbinix hemicellulosilytica TaxID=1564487 RepID=A0A0H5SGV6_HERHM|nr:hypothetical protein [Herbinix hemicellulosilytica]RBP59550.1 hypothetical protein DFR55_10533 [Herbinix hemicellulosilytica]CRZ34737.1 putative membrane protein [Herbinix hemicellulosilytica]HPU63932.1 hypothetical protein [Mobilitalea sp.]
MKSQKYFILFSIFIIILLSLYGCKKKSENIEPIEDLLLSQLDWKADDFLSFLDDEKQKNIISIKNIYYGDFTDDDEEDLLVLFHVSHDDIGGRDHYIAAVYNRKSLDIRTQQTILSENVSIYVLPYENGKDYILCVGNTVYQGIPAYTAQLYQIQDNNWASIPISNYNQDDSYIYAVTDNSLLHIVEIKFDDHMEISYNYMSTLYWDSFSGKFVDISESGYPYR